jgi:hypothetical protein
MIHNIKMLSKEGEILFYTSIKKAKFHVRKGHAILIDESTYQFTKDRTPRHTFVTDIEKKIEEYVKTPMITDCVICSEKASCSRCIVPDDLRKYLPQSYLRSKSHTFWSFCEDCESNLQSYYHHTVRDLCEENKIKITHDSTCCNSLAKVFVDNKNMSAYDIEKYWAQLLYKQFLPSNLSPTLADIYDLHN